MRTFHNEICGAFEEAQEEIIKMKNDRSERDKEKEDEILVLKNKFQDIEGLQYNLEK